MLSSGFLLHSVSAFGRTSYKRELHQLTEGFAWSNFPEIAATVPFSGWATRAMHRSSCLRLATKHSPLWRLTIRVWTPSASPFTCRMNDPDHRQHGTVTFAYPAFDERRTARRSSHHESREAVPIVQAAFLAGIVIGVTRFGTVPDTMIVDDTQWRPVCKTTGECVATQPLTFDDTAIHIGEREFEHVFCKINSDGCSMHGGGLR